MQRRVRIHPLFRIFPHFYGANFRLPFNNPSIIITLKWVDGFRFKKLTEQRYFFWECGGEITK